MRGNLRGYAEDDRQHAFRQSGIHERARHFERGGWRLLSRFHDARAPGGQRRSQLAARIADRKIPRRERGHRADRLSQDGHPHARCSLRQHASISPSAFLGVPFQGIGRDMCLHPRFVDGLAFFDGRDARDMLGAFMHKIRRAFQNLAAILRRHAAPNWISFLGGVQRPVQVCFGCVRQHADAFAGRWIHHRLVLPAVWGRPFAANEKV